MKKTKRVVIDKVLTVREVMEILVSGRIIYLDRANCTLDVHLGADGKLRYLDDNKTREAVDFSREMGEVRYEEVLWYEDIPENGVLCWVSDYSINPTKDTCKTTVTRITGYEDSGYLEPYHDNIFWKFATPLTQEEADKLIYKGN